MYTRERREEMLRRVIRDNYVHLSHWVVVCGRVSLLVVSVQPQCIVLDVVGV